MSKSQHKRRQSRISFRYTIWLYFTIMLVLFSVGIGVLTDYNYRKNLRQSTRTETQALIDQVYIPLNRNIRDLLKVSDSIYYDVIKTTDIKDNTFQNQLKLACDMNDELIDSIAIFSKNGRLLESSAERKVSKNWRPTKEKWFKTAFKVAENVQFAAPQIQKLFEVKEDNYEWVIPVSKSITYIDKGETRQGVLLINMRYESIWDIMTSTIIPYGYIYLTDSKNNIIYHPLDQVISSGIVPEENYYQVTESGILENDGISEMEIRGETRVVSVKTLGYTGWKIVGIVGDKLRAVEYIKARFFQAFICVLLSGLLFLINVYISNRIYRPIEELEHCVKSIEEGNMHTVIDIGGAREVRHLGKAIERMEYVINQLMDGIGKEHELKRKSEMDALQSQINPHFLYNTLDIMVWLIENGKEKDAVNVVTSLAKFFRIILAKESAS